MPFCCCIISKFFDRPREIRVQQVVVDAVTADGMASSERHRGIAVGSHEDDESYNVANTPRNSHRHISFEYITFSSGCESGGVFSVVVMVQD